MITSQPKAYSYVRFSSQSQSGGDSLRRQTVAAQAYAAEHKLTLDTTLNMHDLGISAFKGKNFAEGALGQFIVAVDDGRVEKGSFLLVEHLDRLSRLPVMDALHIFQEIIRRGICIVTLRDKIVYSQENLNANWTTLIIALATMSGSNEESEKKADRVGKKWETKKIEARSELKPIGNIAPLWLKYISMPEPAYIIIEAHADIIRRIFDLTIRGHGKIAIAKTLNAESIKSFKPPTNKSPNQTWGSSSLQKILSNRALLGEYQPHIGRGEDRKPTGAPILGYYPAVITEDTFYQAQQATASRRIAGATKQTERFNVWQGIARCNACFGPLHLVNKGKPPKGGTYLHCHTARKGLCKAKSIRLDQSELVFAEILTKVDSLSLVQDSSASISKQIAAIDGRLLLENEKQKEYKAALAARYSKTLDDVTHECEQIIDTLSKEKEALLIDLASETITNKQNFFDRLDLSNYEIRYRANALLKRINAKVFIGRSDTTIDYILCKDDKNILGVIQYRTGEIVNVAFTENMLNKVKSQDFDGSINSSINMLITESKTDLLLKGEWWDDATLDEKIEEMINRVDVAIPADSKEFQRIRDILKSSQAHANSTLQASLDELKRYRG
jgi:DNA invertase Pin-like site-specific DNA recombinase